MGNRSGPHASISNAPLDASNAAPRGGITTRFAVNHKWREPDLSDFEVASRKGKVDTNW